MSESRWSIITYLSQQVICSRPVTVEHHKSCIMWINQILQPLFGGGGAHLFGSSLSDLGFRTSDLDITFKHSGTLDPYMTKYDTSLPWPSCRLPKFLPSSLNTVQPEHTSFTMGVRIERVGNSLRRHGMENVIVISQARVPIVKFKDPRYNLSCDLNSTNMVQDESEGC